MSITFDDAYFSHTYRVMPLLERFGFRGTFYVIVDKLLRRGKYGETPCSSLADWQAGAQRGHEIGSHTVTHEPLDTLPPLALRDELLLSRAWLRSTFLDQNVNSVAYPFSRWDGRVQDVADLVYTSARGDTPQAGSPPYNLPATVDLLNIVSPFLSPREPVAAWNRNVSDTMDHGGWLVETIHAVDEPGYDRIALQDLADHLHHLSRCMPGLWVAPVSVVAERIASWRQLGLEVTQVTDIDISLRLASTAADQVLDPWHVEVVVDDAEGWRAHSTSGSPMPTDAEGDTLRFVWQTAENGPDVLLSRDPGSAIRRQTWGRVKDSR